MGNRRSLSWFYQLDRADQAVLLARPHGYLPDGVAAKIEGHTVPAGRDGTPDATPRWQLRSAEANLLEDERLRLDAMWRGLSPGTRAELVASRGGPVPAHCREAILDLLPGGVPPGTDLDVAFDLTGIVAAYVEMAAGDGRGIAV
ncbi:hypothetical protein [[Mycobacterium] burgundiense]|uniref:Uncharacterized protein n=1 Tax=[Mycobacterium] burgundiense TaxID=3064286 RepID=A0ABM9LGR1_9MYCO|nr:hypothetical protein [Mycolicibacterium sp. MU0053]CAJ1498741.1 hypothetical protein MU0053_001234 [Mycolicibacterium sp. MU0053]